MNNEVITITDPQGDAEVAQRVHDAIVVRERELREEFAAIAERLTPDGYAATKADWTRLKKIDGELKNAIESVEAKALAFAKADGVLYQLKETRKNLAEAYKQYWARFVELRDAGKVKEPPRSWVIRIDATGEQFEKLAKAAEKAGCPFSAFATPQSDKAAKAIQKWFEENV